MSLHPEILDDAQRRVLAALDPVLAERGFYLAGGTAVALHLGHRRSVDLDFFSESPMGDPLQLARALRDLPLGFETRSTDRGTLHGTVASVRVSLLEYRYPLLQPLAGGGRREPGRAGSRGGAAARHAGGAVGHRAAKRSAHELRGRLPLVYAHPCAQLRDDPSRAVSTLRTSLTPRRPSRCAFRTSPGAAALLVFSYRPVGYFFSLDGSSPKPTRPNEQLA